MYAGPQATLDVVLETGSVQFAIDLDVTGSKQEMAIDDLDGVASQRGREIGAEIASAVVENTACQYDSWIIFIDS